MAFENFGHITILTQKLDIDSWDTVLWDNIQQTAPEVMGKQAEFLPGPLIMPFSSFFVIAQRSGSGRLKDSPEKWLDINQDPTCRPKALKL